MTLKLIPIFLCLSLLNPKSIFGSCNIKNFSITQELNDPYSDKAVFLCKVDTTFILLDGSYGSTVHIIEKFRNPPDSKRIRLLTGGNTTAGGGALRPGNTYLIFADKRNEKEYSTWVCDPFSKKIIEKEKRYNTGYLELVRDYFQLTREQYSGDVIFKVKDQILGKGKFKNGRPDGLWHHFAQGDDSALYGEFLKTQSGINFLYKIFQPNP